MARATGGSFPSRTRTSLRIYSSSGSKRVAAPVGGEFTWDGRGAHALEWARVRADTKLKLYGLERRSVLQGHRAQWDAMRGAIDVGSPPSASHTVVGSALGPVGASLTSKWIQLAMHDVYQSMSTGGLVIGLYVAFAILLVVTRSLAIALIAVVSLVQVIMGVFASLRVVGWALGIVESLCLILVSSLSVDTSCTSRAPTQSGERTRVARTDDAISRLGAAARGHDDDAHLGAGSCVQLPDPRRDRRLRSLHLDLVVGDRADAAACPARHVRAGPDEGDGRRWWAWCRRR